nr:MAG TPA: hypothetical protein [Caudoviricetes sp.]
MSHRHICFNERKCFGPPVRIHQQNPRLGIWRGWTRYPGRGGVRARGRPLQRGARPNPAGGHPRCSSASSASSASSTGTGTGDRVCSR